MFSSNFGRIWQNYKLNGLGLLQCSGRGVLCRRGRAASARDATRLATQLLPALPRADVLIHCRFNDVRIKPRAAVEKFLLSLNPDADELRPRHRQIRLTRCLSKPFEHTSSSALSPATDCAP